MKIPNGRQASLLTFCVLHHHQQQRKYTNEPYINHCKQVAEMVEDKCNFGWEIGMCHDLLEDTNCTDFDLIAALDRFGYTAAENRLIVHAVIELTDVYTHEAFPKLNRANRKALEAARLHKISYEAQTVKYCDLINNTASIVEYDRGFAVKYLAEKASILKGMNKGNPAMFAKCKRVLKAANKKLSL